MSDDHQVIENDEELTDSGTEAGRSDEEDELNETIQEALAAAKVKRKTKIKAKNSYISSGDKHVNFIIHGGVSPPLMEYIANIIGNTGMAQIPGMPLPAISLPDDGEHSSSIGSSSLPSSSTTSGLSICEEDEADTNNVEELRQFYKEQRTSSITESLVELTPQDFEASVLQAASTPEQNAGTTQVNLSKINTVKEAQEYLQKIGIVKNQQTNIPRVSIVNDSQANLPRVSVVKSEANLPRVTLDRQANLPRVTLDGQANLPRVTLDRQENLPRVTVVDSQGYGPLPPRVYIEPSLPEWIRTNNNYVEKAGYRLWVSPGTVYINDDCYYVHMRHRERYQLAIKNSTQYNSNVDIYVEDEWVWRLRLDPGQVIDNLYHPQRINKYFVFYKAVDAPESLRPYLGQAFNGLVKCVFTPELQEDAFRGSDAHNMDRHLQNLSMEFQESTVPKYRSHVQDGSKYRSPFGSGITALQGTAIPIQTKPESSPIKENINARVTIMLRMIARLDDEGVEPYSDEPVTPLSTKEPPPLPFFPNAHYPPNSP